MRRRKIDKAAYKKQVLEEKQRQLDAFVFSDTPYDYRKLFNDILKNKKHYIIILPIATLYILTYALSLPVYYETDITLAPEVSGDKTKSTMLKLVSSLGVDLDKNIGQEAIYPALYPQVMNSVEFKIKMLGVKIRRENDKKEYTYYDYLVNEQKTPWWSDIKIGLIGLFKPNVKPDPYNPQSFNSFKLTNSQTLLLEAVGRLVSCKVDKKTQVITITATDQDPLVSALLADTAKILLQRFITEYRTTKSKNDLDYYKKLLVKSKENYKKASKIYSEFVDANQDAITKKIQVKELALEQEMYQQYVYYEEIANRYRQAEMEVQQDIPAFTTLRSASVPLGRSGPPRTRICFLFIFLTLLAITIWVMNKENDIKPFVKSL